MKATIREAQERKIGMIYVTDADGANPWDRLPSYWDAEVAAVREINAGRNAGRSREFGFQVIGYLPDYRLKSFDPAAAAGVTDLIFFSIECKPSGELDRRRLSDDALRRLREVKDRHGVRLIIAVGGWNRSKGFAPMATDAAARARFVNELAQLCRDERIDGVDFDWEHPKNAAEEEAYAALLKAMTQALAPSGSLVSVTVAAWQNLPPAAFEVADRVHLMAYDHDGQHSTLERAKADVEMLVRKGAPKRKICLGVPFYGRGIRDRARTQTYSEIMRQHKPAPSVDEVDGFYFNGIETIQAKTRFAKDSGLGGVMIWELGQDTNDDTSLLQAIRSVRSSSAQ
jgi:GH18 family chitinase